MDTLNVIFTFVTGVVTYIIGHKRAKKEVENQALINLEKSIEIYNIIINDMKNQVETLLKKVNELEDKIDELMVENESLKQMLKKEKQNASSKPQTK